jgi:hypothetical protein
MNYHMKLTIQAFKGCSILSEHTLSREKQKK